MPDINAGWNAHKHMAEACRLLNYAETLVGDPGGKDRPLGPWRDRLDLANYCIARAQAHATLANRPIHSVSEY